LTYEHSAGAVIFRKANENLLYLLLHYEEGHWGCSKGHTEKAETDEETARREIREETGLIDIQFISGFKELNRYSFMTKNGRIDKSVTFLLAETATAEITLSDEHIDAAWLPYEQALDRLTFKNEKEIFQKAHQWVQMIR
jgi:bis(5'-nucleosidyl)-tetraphosphatase